MVGSEDEGREAQGHEARGRSKVPRLEGGVERTTGSEGAGYVGATSSGGAQGALALAANGSPGDGVLGLPGALAFGPLGTQALQPFGASANGLPNLAASQVTAPIVTGYSGAASTLLSPLPIGSPVDQFQVMSPSPDGVERGRMLQEKRQDGSMGTLIEWTRSGQQFVELSELSRITIGNLLQQNQTTNNDLQTMSAEMERLVTHIRAAFEVLNQKLMSRDQDVRTAIECIAGQLEHRDQQLAQVNRRMEEDLAK